MARITVEVDQDHLEHLVKNPLLGLTELVWNSLDADATLVEVDVELNALDGIEAVTVSDNGYGMNLERIQLDFSHLGGSWKKTKTATRSGRGIHGRAGQGRFAAFALGEQLSWTSVAETVTGGNAETVVSGRRSALRDFDISVPVPTAAATGTVFEARGLTTQTETALAADGVADALTAAFALYLEKYPVDIRWRGKALDSATLQADRIQIQLTVGDEVLELVIIEWKRTVKRSLHLCDAGGSTLHEMLPGIHAPGFDFTAYLKWDGFNEIRSQLALESLAEEPLPAIITAAQDAMRKYFKARADQKGRQLVEAWKEDKSYPYSGEPQGAVQTAERELFEIIAVAAAPVVEAADQGSRKFSLRLLREAIETRPAGLNVILQEVLDLSEDRIQELQVLIERSSLGSIISAARMVTDRLAFLDGLEQIVLGPNFRKHLKERSQLHRIIAAETWIFGEEFALTADDKTLTTALRDHVEILGRDMLAPEDLDELVLDGDGRHVVVDVMLSRSIAQHRNRREHLIIELKRPTVHIGMEELGQIQNYASTVARDSRFAAVETQWEFWIVGDQKKDAVSDLSDPVTGIVGTSRPGTTTRVVTWAQIIQDARHRLRFVQEALEYVSDPERGMEYLRETHAKYLPDIAKLEDPAQDMEAVNPP